MIGREEVRVAGGGGGGEGEDVHSILNTCFLTKKTKQIKNEEWSSSEQASNETVPFILYLLSNPDR